MSWRLVHSERFEKSLRKLDRPIQRRVLAKLLAIAELDDPTGPCKALSGPLAGLWRVRIGGYRAIVDIRRGELVIVALDVDGRGSIYDD